MVLAFGVSVRRYVGLAVLLFFAVPFGASLAGCKHATAVDYCNAGDSGPTVGQVSQIILSQNLAATGESLNYGQIGQGLSASGQDCKGNAVSLRNVVYSSTSSFGSSPAGSVFADINPTTGSVCGGLWNRNSGGGIADYTTCTAPTLPPASTAFNLNSPTTAANGVASSISLTVAKATDLIYGVLSLGLGTAGQHSITLASGSTISSFATQINNDATFSAEGIKALLTGTTLTITGPTPPSGGGGTTYTLNTMGSAVYDDPQAYVAYVTATAEGTVSNAIAVYVHPVATGVVLGAATPPGNCPTSANPNGTDPGTDCFPIDTSGTQVVAPVYTGSTCLSQNTQGQLVARVYANGKVDAADNITGKVGKISYAVQGASNVVTIDPNGVATANLPGSAIITTTIANSSSGSSAGYFATCPPASITLAIPGQPAGTSTVNVSLNTPQPLTATVLDTNGNPITGLNLEYNSTTPQTIPGSSSITPIYVGTAVITAVCQPGTCNPSPFSQIGLYGNGKPITSNGITVNATGTSGTVLYMASTQSQYVLPADFTVTAQQSFIKLQYPPNSMVLSQDGSTLYLGSPQGLMTISTGANTATAPNQNYPGLVLAVSPDGGTVVVTDPTRQTISLLGAGGSGLRTAYNGIGTHATFSPDSQLLYVTTTSGTLLTYSAFTDWQPVLPAPSEVYTDAVVTVPSIGAYFAGATTDGRSYCSTSTITAAGNPPTESNAFAPLADMQSYPTDRLGATTDGSHILGANATTLTDLSVTFPVTGTQPNGPRVCTTATAGVTFSSTATTKSLAGITAAATTTPIQTTVGSAITGVIPSSNSAVAFVTYNGSSGKLPLYVPSTGTLTLLTLGNGATTASAPVSGVFSTDNLNFYAGTSGDDQVHIFSISGTSATEKSVITPRLPDANGNPVQVNLLAQRPKKLTN